MASLRALYLACVVASGALAGAWASRSLADWEEGRWWMLTVGLDAAAVAAAVFAVVFGVSALGEITRRRSAVKGTGLAALGLGLGCALLVVSGLRLGQDWEELDVPAAWDRLDIGGDDGRSVEDFADSARLATAASDGNLRTEGRVGGCYQGTVREPGVEVACRDPHTLFLVGQTVLEDDPDAGVGERRRAGGEACVELIEDRLGGDTAGGSIRAIVPDQLAWVAGDRGTVCLIEFDEPVRGSLPR